MGFWVRGRFSPAPNAAVGGCPAEKEAGVVRRPRLHRRIPLPPRHELHRSDADGARGMDTGQFAYWSSLLQGDPSPRGPGLG